MDAELKNLLEAAWLALRQPRTLVEVGTLLLCFGVAFVLRGWLGRWVDDRQAEEGASAARRFGKGGLRRVLFPLVALALVLPARFVLHRHGPVPLLDLAVPLMSSMALIRLFAYSLRKAFISSRLIAHFERAFALLAWGVVALHIIGWLPEVIDALESVSFTFGKQKLNLWTVLQGLALVMVSLLVALWGAGLIERRLLHAEDLDGNLRLVLARFTKAVLLVVSVLIVLPVVGIDLTTLSVFGGAIGVGLGFGLQKIAANYVSGFIILMDRSLRLGNLIAVGAERGVVTQITTRYTVIRAGNGVESLIPNETLVSSVVQNETFSDDRVVVPIEVQVGYDTDLERVLPMLEEIGRAHPRVLPDPAPRAMLVAFADSGINLRMGCWVGNPQDGVGLVRSEILLAIWRRFREEGIEIPYPQREVRVLQEGAAARPPASPAAPAGKPAAERPILLAGDAAGDTA